MFLGMLAGVFGCTIVCVQSVESTTGKQSEPLR